MFHISVSHRETKNPTALLRQGKNTKEMEMKNYGLHCLFIRLLMRIIVERLTPYCSKIYW